MPAVARVDRGSHFLVAGQRWTDTDPANLQRGVIYRYNQSLDIYRCPSDRSTVKDQGKIPRNRSVSMSMYMNFRPRSRQSGLSLCWHRMDQILRPSPSRAAVFIDENEKSIHKAPLASTLRTASPCSRRPCGPG